MNLRTRVSERSPRGVSARPTQVALWPEDGPKPLIAVKWWAGLGVGFVAMSLLVGVRYLTSENLRPVPPGPDKLPLYTLIEIRTLEILSIPIALGCLYYWGIRPWRRDRRMPRDFALMIGCMSLWWMDGLFNYTQVSFTENAHFVNLGSWTGSIPGNLMPNGSRWTEAILAWGPSVYLWGLFLPMVLGCAALGYFRRRWPHWSYVKLFSLLFACWIVWQTAWEWAMIATEVMAFPGVVGRFTLFAGKPYQMPLYEGVFEALWYSSYTAIRWFANDKGHLLFERGLDKIATKPWKENVLRILGAAGCCGLAFLITYMAPYQYVNARIDTWAKGLPSYLQVREVCGPGTAYPCPGKGVPIFRTDSKTPVLPPPTTSE